MTKIACCENKFSLHLKKKKWCRVSCASRVNQKEDKGQRWDDKVAWQKKTLLLARKRFKEFLCLRFRWVHIRFHEWRGGESRNLLTAVVTDGWASIHHTVQLVPLLLPWTKWKPEYILPAPCTSTRALFPQSTAVPVEKRGLWLGQ